MNLIHHDHSGIWFCVPCTLLRVFLLSAFRKRSRSIRNNTERMPVEVDRLRSVKCSRFDNGLCDTLNAAQNVMSELCSSWLIFACVVGARTETDPFMILRLKIHCLFISLNVSWTFLSKHAKSYMFSDQTRTDDFEPIQSYVCINVLLQIDTEIKGRTILRITMLCGSIPKEMSFRSRSVRIGFLEIPVSAGKCDLSNSHLVILVGEKHENYRSSSTIFTVCVYSRNTIFAQHWQRPKSFLNWTNKNCEKWWNSLAPTRDSFITV